MKIDKIKKLFAELQLDLKEKESASPRAFEVDVKSLKKMLVILKSHKETQFDFLKSHTVVDHKERDQFELVYVLYSTALDSSLMVTTYVERKDPRAPTVSDLWAIAEWQEREVYDLFGVLYEGHKDLRRLFLEDGWKGFPLRKDYEDSFMLPFPEK